MDTIFLLGDGDRASFLEHIMQAFGCSCVCLWSYLPPPSNCLLCVDGLYREPANQPMSSGVQRLFTQYQQALFNVDNGCVPGLAFKNHLPYMELTSAELQRLACTQVQLQFYQEAGIKMAVFMGCNNGEIEFGTSSYTQINLELEMKHWFPEDFNRLLTDQNGPSSFSSSLGSLSAADRSEYSHPHLFNIPSTSHIPIQATEAIIEQTIDLAPPASTNIGSQQEQAIRDMSLFQNIQFPRLKNNEDAPLTQAFLAVIPSRPSSSSSSPPLQSQQNPSSFTSYISAALMAPRVPRAAAITQRPSVFTRAITFYRSLNLMRSQEVQVPGSRPKSSVYQLNHIISERRRREKHNVSFRALKSLLPPGAKKDKASVLASATKYLSSLKTQVAELSERNQMLEAKILPEKEATDQDGDNINAITERVDVRIRPVAAAASTSTSEATLEVDLQVAVRGQQRFTMLGFVVAVLDLLKQVKNVSLLSIDANVRMVDPSPLNRMKLRLKIEEGEWDESALQEAVKRVVGDLAE